MKGAVGITMMGIVVLLIMSMLFVPSLAQQECWDRILTCLNGTESRAEFREECCSSFLGEIINERECFCSIKPNLDQNSTATINRLLAICNSTSTFNAFCPDSVAPAPSPIEALPSPSPVQSEDQGCWDPIVSCLNSNQNQTGLDPSLDPSSPSFNVTEFLCCPLMQQTARTEKECFCTINPLIQGDPDESKDIILIFSACNIAHSAASLDNFCSGEAPSTQALPLQAGTMESFSNGARLLSKSNTTSGNTEAEKGAANKIAIIGSLSGLIVLFTYVLFH